MSTEQPKNPSPVEVIKDNSNYLRGSIENGLQNELTGSLHPDDTQLSKFHGIYQQTARELDSERKRQKLEPLYSFMVRVRLPGGIATPEQWLEMDRLSDTYANGTLRLTTRQAFQFHGVYKRNLKKHIAEINKTLLDTIAACGDVNRNVMCSPNPEISAIHYEANQLALDISKHLTPQTRAYHEIWMDEEFVAGSDRSPDTEPIYGKTYLPRKFKIAIAVPPDNDTDVFTNDVGLIAIVEKGKLTGYNLIAGGGMGTTLDDKRTYPRLADVIGFFKKGDIIRVVEEIVKIQRDNGNREDRRIARLKYTLANKGIDWFKAELESRSGIKIEKPKPYKFLTTSDRYGWTGDVNGKWNYTLFIENGRVKDTPENQMKTALSKIALLKKGDFRLTGNQNVIIAGVDATNKKVIEKILKEHGSLNNQNKSGIRLNSLACVALNTCPLAFAEAETYLPSLLNKIEVLLESHNIKNQDITIRMTGCPNGCARPYNSEIGLVGRAPGIYNLYIGGSHLGIRLNSLYKEMLKEEQILTELSGLFEQYSKNRVLNERFGDYAIRTGIVTPTIYSDSI